MNRIFFVIILIFVSTLIISQFTVPVNSVLDNSHTNSNQTIVSAKENTVKILPTATRISLPNATFISQTFNNCGPASLSMLLGILGKNVSQEELASKMRPFNNPYGGVDDKSVFPEEIVQTATEYGFHALHRPNGDISKLKMLISNGIPVLVRTYLNPTEDIGHYRIVTGYDDERKVFTQDDSYQGSDIEYSYSDFENMWKPFNHEYVIVYPKEKEEVVGGILKDDMQERVAWRHALATVEKSLSSNPDDISELFNLSMALYHVGKYEESVKTFERVKEQISFHTLWYQLEPFDAYLKLQKYDQLFTLSDQVLNNGNVAYSELYWLRGQALQAQGKSDEAKNEFAKAYEYNRNFDMVKKALSY